MAVHLYHAHWTKDCLCYWLGPVHPILLLIASAKAKASMCISEPSPEHSLLTRCRCSGPEVIKPFSCSTQLYMKLKLLIKTKIQTNEEVNCFKSLRCCIYPANKCKNANNCWHFNSYEQDTFRAQLSWAWINFYNLGGRPCTYEQIHEIF